MESSNTTVLQEVVVGLKMRNEQQLDALIARQSDLTSPDFYRFITPADFDERYGPLQSDVDQVTRFGGSS